jgi:hypothetical protein
MPPCLWGKGGHTVRYRVPLVLEEDGEVVLGHVAQHYVSRPSARCASVHLATSSTLGFPADVCAVSQNQKHLTYNVLAYQPLFTGCMEDEFSEGRLTLRTVASCLRWKKLSGSRSE